MLAVLGFIVQEVYTFPFFPKLAPVDAHDYFVTQVFSSTLNVCHEPSYSLLADENLLESFIKFLLVQTKSRKETKRSEGLKSRCVLKSSKRLIKQSILTFFFFSFPFFRAAASRSFSGSPS